MSVFFAFLLSVTLSLQLGGFGPDASLFAGPVVFSLLPLGPVKSLLNVAVWCWKEMVDRNGHGVSAPRFARLAYWAARYSIPNRNGR